MGNLVVGPIEPATNRGFFGGAVAVCHLPGQFRGPLVDGEGLILQLVFGQHNGSGTEGIGFDHIAAHLQKLAMNFLHGLRTGEDQVFIATLQGGPPKSSAVRSICCSDVSGGAIEHQDWVVGAVEPIEKTNALHG